MKKKLLESQNASFFAELERKGNEIKTLEIKLEDSENALNDLKGKYALLEDRYNSSVKEIKEQELLIEELREKVLSLNTKAASASLPVITMDTPLTDKEKEFFGIAETEPSKTESYNENEPLKNTESLNTDSIGGKNDELNKLSFSKIPLFTGENFIKPDNTPKQEATTGQEAASKEDTPAGQEATAKEGTPTKEGSAQNEPAAISYEELKAEGLKAIGEITRLAARKIAEAVGEDAETYKNLILGKNESFKLEILSVLENKSPTLLDEVKIMELTDAAKEYMAKLVM